MPQLDTFDYLVLIAVVLGTFAYSTKGRYWAVAKDPYATTYPPLNSQKAGQTRDIIEKLEKADKNCVVFYGSQTGTAEDYASRLAKEASSRFGLKSMIADLEDYDYENLDVFPADKVCFFVLATYGEGEPTDNAIEFNTFITDKNSTFSDGGGIDDKPLDKLNFVAFGLGNNTYEHYNSMVRNVTKSLRAFGAHQIGAAGEGDDGAGTMEEDFLTWKEPMWQNLAQLMNLTERESIYEPLFKLTEKADLEITSDQVYLGELHRNHMAATPKGPFDSHNPYVAPVIASREIFTVKDRNCLHIELDISDTNLSYETGDHVAVWPTNADTEVDNFLEVLGIKGKRHQVVDLTAVDATTRVPIPSPTTYDSIARHYLEICGPVSRQFVATLAQFAPNNAAKMEMNRLGSDREMFARRVSQHYMNISALLRSVCASPWTRVPFSIMAEEIKKLQPRYYSISSSALVQENQISITAVVESRKIAGSDRLIKGVATNYLLALKQKQHDTAEPEPHGLSYAIDGPRNKYAGLKVPIHVRRSNFKLPSDPSNPIIMVGPGSGVAPFRGFIQERAALAGQGIKVGKTILFYGCRRESEDYLYQEDWKKVQQSLGDQFLLVTAFSRSGPKKVYVQDRLEEHAELVDTLLKTQNANFYVCGDAANMAREVSARLAKIISGRRCISLEKAESVVKDMRASNQYQEDVWS